jgi:hypothetical protein
MLRLIAKNEGDEIIRVTARYRKMHRPDSNDVVKRMLVYTLHTTHLTELDFVRSKIVLDNLPCHSGFNVLTVRMHRRIRTSRNTSGERAETNHDQYQSQPSTLHVFRPI